MGFLDGVGCKWGFNHYVFPAAGWEWRGTESAEAGDDGRIEIIRLVVDVKVSWVSRKLWSKTCYTHSVPPDWARNARLILDQKKKWIKLKEEEKISKSILNKDLSELFFWLCV